VWPSATSVPPSLVESPKCSSSPPLGDDPVAICRRPRFLGGPRWPSVSPRRGHRADGYDNDTSGRAGDKRGDPERDRDHAIGLRAGSPPVVAATLARPVSSAVGPPRSAAAQPVFAALLSLRPVALQRVSRTCARLTAVGVAPVSAVAAAKSRKASRILHCSSI
jgi:hypothetical protein